MQNYHSESNHVPRRPCCHYDVSEKYFSHPQAVYHDLWAKYLYSLGKEEVLSEVAAEGLEAALVVQQLFSHQRGHPCRAVDPKKVAEKDGCQNLRYCPWNGWNCSPVEIHSRMEGAEKYFFKR